MSFALLLTVVKGPSIKYVTRKGEGGGGLSQRDDAYIKYTISMGKCVTRGGGGGVHNGQKKA